MQSEASTTLNRAGAHAGPWIERFARFGYAAKGVVYLLVGGIALRGALAHGQVEDSSGALRVLQAAPLGLVLVALVAFGLFGYALWRLYCALADPEDDGGAKRAYFALTGLAHLGLAAEAARLALGAGGGAGGNEAAHWSATLLSKPFGAWILGAVGLALAAWGVAQLVRAWQAELDEQLDLSALGRAGRRWAIGVARVGLAARGVVFLLIGTFVLRAALRFDPAQARGVGGALESLRRHPYGGLLLGAVACGLAAYGLYELLRARYRGIRAAAAGGGGTYIRLERT